MMKNIMIFTLQFLLIFIINSYAEKQNASKNIGLGVNLGGQVINPDDGFGTGIAPAFEGYLRYMMNKQLNLACGVGYGLLSDYKNFTTTLIVGDIRGNYLIQPDGKYRPYVSFGVGMHLFKFAKKPGSTAHFTRQDNEGMLAGFSPDLHVFPGLGCEIFLNPKIAFNALADYRFVITGGADELDGQYKPGTSKDNYMNFRAGLTFYFEDQLTKQVTGAEKLIAGIENSDSESEPSGGSPFSESDSDGKNLEKFAVFESKIDRLEETETDLNMEQYVRLKSRVDELKKLISQRSNEIDELQTSLTFKDTRVRDLEDELEQLESNKDSQTGSLADATFSSGYAKQSFDNFNKAYEKALQNYYANNYSRAIQEFTNLIKSQPNHRLASNCQYWIGESYFGMGNYSEAITAFKNVLNYSQTYKKDDAMLMLGQCCMRLKDYTCAREYLQVLVRDYPNSEYTSRAENLLGKLN